MAKKAKADEYVPLEYFDNIPGILSIDFETGKEYLNSLKSPEEKEEDEEADGTDGLSHNITLFSLAGRDPGNKKRIIGASYLPENFHKWYKANQKREFVAHNAVFENWVLAKNGFDMSEQYNWHDSMIMAHLLNEERPKGLKDLRVSVLGKPERKGWDQIDKTNLVEYMRYSADDAIDCLELYEHFLPKITEEGLETVYEIERAILPVLTEMRCSGVLLDVELAKRQKEMLVSFLEQIQKYIEKTVGYELNLKSSKDLQEVFYDILAYPAREDWKTKTGISTNARVLEAIAADSSRPVAQGIAEQLLDHRKYTKLLTSFLRRIVEDAPRSGNRLYPSFNSTGTVTGRFSCTKPNLQQIPGKSFIKGDPDTHVRSLFIAEPGHQLVTVDYSQIELRLMAEFSNDKTLVKAYKDGLDIHQITADLIKCERKQAKVINFGIGYGMGPGALSMQARIPFNKAANFIRAYWAKYPGVLRLKEYCVRISKAKGYLRTWSGRKRRFSEWNIHTENQTMNFLIQGSAADLMKLAMAKVHRMKDHSRAKCLMTVHDELTYSVRDDYVQEFMYVLQYCLETAIDTKVPIIAEPSFGPRWSESKE